MSDIHKLSDTKKLPPVPPPTHHPPPNPSDPLAANKIDDLAARMFQLEESSLKATEEITRLRETVDDLLAGVKQFLARVTDRELDTHLVPGMLKNRIEKEHAEEKKALAKYVARNPTFFPDRPVYAFVQASVTAIHLARELAALEHPLRADCLFVTNSVVLPLILLQDNCQVSVYTLCGTEFDPACGGWLPRNGDQGAINHLTDLFARGKDPLEDAYITPMAVTCDKGELLFTRVELLKVIGVLLQRAKRPVIMTVSSRLLPTYAKACENAALINTNLHKIRLNGRLAGQGERPQLVVARDPADHRSDDELLNLLNQMKANGFDFHWQDKAGQWKVVTGQEL